MGKYWQILKRYKVGLLISPLLVLITVLCETIQPMFMAEIIDNGVMPRDLSVITRIGTYMVLVSVGGLLVSIVNTYISSRIGIGFGTDLRGTLFNKIQQLSFSISINSVRLRLSQDLLAIYPAYSRSF